MTHSSEQTLKSLINTLHKPSNQVSVIQQAFIDNKPAVAGLPCPVAGHHEREEARCGCLKS
jgi:coenzyme F420-reducing hydrogenase beta subunit